MKKIFILLCLLAMSAVAFAGDSVKIVLLIPNKHDTAKVVIPVFDVFIYDLSQAIEGQNMYALTYDFDDTVTFILERDSAHVNSHIVDRPTALLALQEVVKDLPQGAQGALYKNEDDGLIYSLKITAAELIKPLYMLFYMRNGKVYKVYMG